MNKDEIKNRISLALKDPILQQGFEIICKENTELKADNDARKFAMAMSEKVEKQLREENAELKEDLETQKRINREMITPALDRVIKQLTNAKEIIKMLHSDCYSIAECEDTNLGLWEDDLAKAEAFLNSEVEK